jgi:hypothetical protein
MKFDPKKMLKGLLLMTLFTLSSSTFSQSKLEGKYYFNKSFGFYSCYTFSENNTFTITHGGDLGPMKYGEGQYQIKNDSIHLVYNLTPLQFNHYHKIKHYENNDDFVNIKVTVLDMNGNPLSNIMVDTQVDRRISKTNGNGIVVFKLKKKKKRNQVVVSDPEYGLYSFDLWDHLNYDIQVFLKKDPRRITPLKGDILSYQIVKQTDTTITLKNNNHILVLEKE